MVLMVQERQGPKDIVLKTLSAIAAAQLAVLPFSGQPTFHSITPRPDPDSLNAWHFIVHLVCSVLI